MEEFFKDGMYNYHQLIHFGDDPDHVVDILPLRRGGGQFSDLMLYSRSCQKFLTKFLEGWDH